MSTSRTDVVTVALVGASSVLTEFLALLAGRPRMWNLRLGAVVAITDDPTATALQQARTMGVPLVTNDIAHLEEMPDPGLIVVLDQEPDVVADVRKRLPAGTPMLDGAPAAMLTVIEHLSRTSLALRADSHRLKETRLRLSQFVETAPLAIYIKDRDLRYKRMNAHALHVLGLKEGSVVGQTDRTLYPAGGARWLQNVERETLRTGDTVHATGILPVQGCNMHVQVTLFPVIEDGQVEGLYGLMEDTTDLYMSEQKLHEVDEQLTETQSYLRGVLENSRDIIFLTDPTGNLLSFNSGAELALGFEEDEVVGTPAHRLCAIPGAFDKLFIKALREGHAISYEAEFRSKDMRPVICNISLTPILGPDGKPLEVVCICRDMTMRLRLKNDLIRSERLAAVGQMASGVAHEINNPLAVIDTIAGLVEETLEDEGQCLDDGTRTILAKAMERLHHQVHRCTNITHSLLGFVRKTESGLSEMNLAELIEESLNVLGPEIRRSGTRVKLHLSDEVPRFRSDPMLLQQVFVNLVKNAVDAVAEVPERASIIGVTSCRDDDQVKITVEDNGVGIPAADRDRIFDLFHTTKPVGTGTGLGLSIVHDILYRLGGSVRVASEPGRWSRFIVTLPLEPPETPLIEPTALDR